MSTVYILGAGFSVPFGYPSSKNLLSALDDFARQGTSLCEEWEQCRTKLSTSIDRAVQRAFEGKNIEEIFTILDFHQELASSRFSESADEYFQTKQTSDKGHIPQKNEELSQNARALSDEYVESRNTLLNALEKFFLHAHRKDAEDWTTDIYNDLRRFSKCVQSGDTVLTFNYDALAERALLACGKWHPRDGYGFDVKLDDLTSASAHSPVQVLHLHGCIGWHDAPLYDLDMEGEFYAHKAGAADPSIFAHVLKGTMVSLNPEFLREIGCSWSDESIPLDHRYQESRRILMTPSYLKQYVTSEWNGTKFSALWAKAIRSIQQADKVVIIGYSLPKADSAAMTLILGISGKTISIVNPEVSVRQGIHDLLNSDSGNTFGENSSGHLLFDPIPKYCLSDWLEEHERGTL